jgi:hypothetical protein
VSVDVRTAGDIHDWLMVERRTYDSPADLETTVDRFLKRWPRVKKDVLEYVSEMLSAQLHPRTVKPTVILKGVRKRIDEGRAPQRRWWPIG